MLVYFPHCIWYFGSVGPFAWRCNQAVIEMLEEIKKDGGDTKSLWQRLKTKKILSLMGFGHRVYKNFDPRAKIIKKLLMRFYLNWV